MGDGVLIGENSDIDGGNLEVEIINDEYRIATIGDGVLIGENSDIDGGDLEVEIINDVLECMQVV